MLAAELRVEMETPKVEGARTPSVSEDAERRPY